MTGRILAAMIVVATALFVIGVSLEKSESHGDHDAGPVTHVEGEGSEEGAEGEEIHQASDGESSELEESDEAGLLGVDTESTLLIVLAVTISLGLAAAVWVSPGSASILLVVGLAMVTLAVLDLREVAHQVDESKNGIALLAALVTLLHAVAAVMAIRLSLTRRQPRPVSP